MGQIYVIRTCTKHGVNHVGLYWESLIFLFFNFFLNQFPLCFIYFVQIILDSLFYFPKFQTLQIESNLNSGDKKNIIGKRQFLWSTLCLFLTDLINIRSYKVLSCFFSIHFKIPWPIYILVTYFVKMILNSFSIWSDHKFTW